MDWRSFAATFLRREFFRIACSATFPAFPKTPASLDSSLTLLAAEETPAQANDACLDSSLRLSEATEQACSNVAELVAVAEVYCPLDNDGLLVSDHSEPHSAMLVLT